MRLYILVALMFCLTIGVFSQKVEVIDEEKLDPQNNGMIEVEYYPFVEIPFGSKNYQATAIQFSVGYLSSKGYYARTQYLNRITLGEGLKKYWEFTYINIGKMFNQGKRFQIPLSASIGMYGYTNSLDVKSLGMKVGAHLGFRFFITNKISIRTSLSGIPYFNLSKRNEKSNGQNFGVIKRIGFGLDFNYVR